MALVNKKNSKAFTEDLGSATSKVKVGIVCNPQLKLALINEAKALKLTLSEYGEVLLENRNTSLGSTQDNQELTSK